MHSSLPSLFLFLPPIKSLWFWFGSVKHLVISTKFHPPMLKRTENLANPKSNPIGGGVFFSSMRPKPSSQRWKTLKFSQFLSPPCWRETSILPIKNQIELVAVFFIRPFFLNLGYKSEKRTVSVFQVAPTCSTWIEYRIEWIEEGRIFKGGLVSGVHAVDCCVSTEEECWRGDGECWQWDGWSCVHFRWT